MNKIVKKNLLTQSYSFTELLITLNYNHKDGQESNQRMFVVWNALSASRLPSTQYRFQYLPAGTAVPPNRYSSTNGKKLQYHHGGTDKVLDN